MEKSKLRVSADSKTDVVQMMISVFDRVETF